MTKKKTVKKFDLSDLQRPPDRIGSLLLDHFLDLGADPEEYRRRGYDKAWQQRQLELRQLRRGKPGRKHDEERAIGWVARYEELKEQYPRDRKKFIIGKIAKEEGLSDKTIRSVINPKLKARGIK